MTDRPPLLVRLIGVVESLLAIPLFLLGLTVVGGIAMNGLIILANAAAFYLVGRNTYAKTPSVKIAGLHLLYLAVTLILSWMLCRMIASG